MITFFPKLEIPKPQVDLWVRALGDIPSKKLLQGVKRFCLTHKEIYPGTNVIAHIREYALGVDHFKSPDEAWGIVNQTIAHTGSYGRPVFDDELIAEAVKRLGWRELCLSENEVSDRAHFFRVYESLMERAKFKLLAGESGEEIE